MDSEYILNFLKAIMGWATSGPVGIIFGALGAVGFLAVLRKFQKKENAARLQSTLDDVSQTAGSVSKDASSSMEENDSLIKAILESKSEVQPEPKPEPAKKPDTQPPVSNVPYLEVPANGKKRMPFDVITKNIPEGTTIMADKKWAIGKVSSSGVSRVTLVSSGNRSIAVKVNDTWYSCPIIIEE